MHVLDGLACPGHDATVLDEMIAVMIRYAGCRVLVLGMAHGHFPLSSQHDLPSANDRPVLDPAASDGNRTGVNN